MFLVIGEKPSVAQALAKVLKAEKKEDGYLAGEDCLVSWCFGHLAEYAPPETYDERYGKWDFDDLPIIPKNWEFSVAKDKKGQLLVLTKLLNRRDMTHVVNACDAGREGELIFKRVYDLSGSTLPVKRLWTSSMEEGAIREGFANLKDGSAYGNLCEAAVCRAKADWLIGMNATRAFTTKYYKRLTVGRVQTPTLAMLAERQEAIDGFVKEAYYKVAVHGNGVCAVSENIKEEADSISIAEQCQGKPAVISSIEKSRKTSRPPKLYDLTTLQREANRIFGYTAQETLRELQALYEAKLVTYPRTDSRYIMADMEQTAMELLELLPEMLPFLQAGPAGGDVGRIIDNDKVSDHHALLPTKEAVDKDLGELPEKQRHIFYLVGQRLAQAVSEECIYEETALTLHCGGHTFSAKGKTLVQPGYKGMEDRFRRYVQKEIPAGQEKAGDAAEDMAPLPDGLCEGMEIPKVTAQSSRHFTSPPKAYTEDTLLAAMERAGSQAFEEDTEKKGLGTPATRASIIEKLVSSGYAERSGRQILPTADGKELIAVLPSYIKSAAMTAEWENKLLLMEKGQGGSHEFLQEITDLIGRMLAECSAISGEGQYRFHTREEIGICPVCGSPVYEGKKNFYCGSRECSFSLWKENRYFADMKKTVDKKMAADLLKNGRTHVKDLYSQKKGKTFAADVLMKTEDGRASFSLEFPRRKGGGKSGRGTGKQ